MPTGGIDLLGQIDRQKYEEMKRANVEMPKRSHKAWHLGPPFNAAV